LAAIGCLPERKICAGAKALYEKGLFRTGRLQVRLVAVAADVSSELTKRYEQVTQLTWRQVLTFVWERFDKYRKQKTDVQQWAPDGQRLKTVVEQSESCHSFVQRVLSEWGPTIRHY
jgi:hypothetical protein